jgi:hypothetical protein
MAARSRRHTALGVSLILLGIAQINVGIRAADAAHSPVLPGLTPRVALWVATILWVATTLGFVAAGFGMLGVSWLRLHWRRLAWTALVGSGVLIVLFTPFYSAHVAVLDALVMLALFRWAPRPPVVDWRAGRFLHVAAAGVLIYLSLLLVLRPWYIRWGTNGLEWLEPLPGDVVVPAPAFNVTRAIEIHAPASQVWPWLAQMGQDRGGFYSYDWLERLLGFDVRNAERLNPAWQHREVGELVRAAPPGFLGGIFGPNFGWRVAKFDPNQRVVLGSPLFAWQFELKAIDSETTRLIARLRGNASPRPGLFFVTIGDCLGGQPVHFIMERKMLRTIKARVAHARL